MMMQNMQKRMEAGQNGCMFTMQDAAELAQQVNECEEELKRANDQRKAEVESWKLKVQDLEEQLANQEQHQEPNPQLQDEIRLKKIAQKQVVALQMQVMQMENTVLTLEKKVVAAEEKLAKESERSRYRTNALS